MKKVGVSSPGSWEEPDVNKCDLLCATFRSTLKSKNRGGGCVLILSALEEDLSSAFPE